MTFEEKIKLIREVGEEIITDEELISLLKNEKEIIAYDGFEPSGQMHLAQGILRAINVNKITQTGVKFKMLVADWHAMANNKMGGDLEKIQTVGRYFIEIWKASGMDLSKVEFVWASDLVKDPDYWQLVIKIGRSNALRRFIRTAEIMGREESLDKLTGAMIIYSCMQAADIFYLGAKICQLGMDQRKVNMLAREIGPGLGFWKPVIVSHHMLLGLQQKQVDKTDKLKATIDLKMSKSKPESAIFMTDTQEEVERKIMKAYCPEGVVEFNPILEYYRYLIFNALDRLGIKKVMVERPEKYGGNVVLNSYQDLEQKFANKEIHPMDLKVTLVKLINQLLDPVRRHFQENQHAKILLEKVKSFQVTR